MIHNCYALVKIAVESSTDTFWWLRPGVDEVALSTGHADVPNRVAL
jgi:hypothetical protein